MAGLDSDDREEMAIAFIEVRFFFTIFCLNPAFGYSELTLSTYMSLAFIFSLLSSYLARPAPLSAQLLSTFESLLALLSACGFEEIVWSDFWEPLRDILRRMGPEEKDGGARKNGEKRLGPGELFDLFNDQETNRFVQLVSSSTCKKQ